MDRWFYTGNVMADGKTKRSVCAIDDVQAKECEDKGWVEVVAKKEVVKPKAVKVDKPKQVVKPKKEKVK